MTLLFATMGCGGTGDALIGNRNPRVRVVNAFPSQNVDASFVDSQGTQNIMADRPFGTVTTEFIPTNGDNTVIFREAGTATEILRRTSLYELNKDYTVVGFGAAGSRNVLIASEAAAPIFGRAAYRVMNVSNGPIDIYTGPSGSTFAAATKVRDDLGTAAIWPYQDIAAGNMRIFITAGNSTTVLAEEDFTFETGKTYTIIMGQNPGPVMFKINSF
jgi:hypothetical protein